MPGSVCPVSELAHTGHLSWGLFLIQAPTAALPPGLTCQGKDERLGLSPRAPRPHCVPALGLLHGERPDLSPRCWWSVAGVCPPRGVAPVPREPWAKMVPSRSGPAAGPCVSPTSNTQQSLTSCAASPQTSLTHYVPVQPALLHHPIFSFDAFQSVSRQCSLREKPQI